VNSVRSWKAEGEEKERGDEGDGNIAIRKVDLWKARRLETCTTGLGRGVRDIRALLWENQSLQPMQRALRLLYIKPNRCRTRFGLETGVAYLSGEFRGKDGWLKEPVEVGISSRFINNIMCRRRVPDLIRQMCHPCLRWVHYC
jgi:hypothetical protein